MKHKRQLLATIKICVDIVMMILFLLLMEYHLVSDAAHEWLGISLFVLFLIHNILNYKWYLVLFKGKYGAVRIIQTIINFLLWIAMLGCIVSAMSISAHVFNWMNISAVSFGRKLHLAATVWAFFLMSLHLGFHWAMFVGKAKKIVHASDKAAAILKWIFRMIVFAICVYGIYNFGVRKLWEEMFLLTEFKWYDYDKTVVLYFIESSAIMILFASVAYYAKKLILQLKKRNKKSEETK